jgi:hypothetical protein
LYWGKDSRLKETLLAKETRGKTTTARKRVRKPRDPARITRRPRRTTKKQEAEQEIAASTSLAYLSKADLRRHIHEGLKPYQHLADQAGMHFLSYIIAMAVEEASGETEKKG